jgi:hypothetical protein
MLELECKLLEMDKGRLCNTNSGPSFGGKELMKLLYGFSGKRIKPISFSTLENSCTEHIIFDVVDIPYPYNAIFG